jgi:ankyrin repeat protein
MVKEITPEQYLQKRQNKKNSPNPWPELLKAVDRNDIQKTKRLIDAGHDVNVQDALGRTALMLSIWWQSGRTKKFELTELLLSAGAQVNIQDKKGESALIRAPFEAAKLLIAHGADANNGSGVKPILHALCIQTMQLLLEHGANIHEVDEDGMNALMWASWAPFPWYKIDDSLQMVRFLVNAGIDINAQDHTGNAALMLAWDQENFMIAHELLKLGADPKIKNIEGKTFIDCIVEYTFPQGCPEVCKECIAIHEMKKLVLHNG